jgi:WD40 repeat protein
MAPGPSPLIDSLGVRFETTEAALAFAFDEAGVTLICGDATVRKIGKDGGEIWRREDVHHGAVLCVAAGADGAFFSGGDDGRVVCTDRDGESREVAALGSSWIDAISVSRKFVAVAVAKQAHVFEIGADKRASFDHQSRVADIAFDADGRRIACAHLDGATIWFAGNPASRGKTLTWKGAHNLIGWSPDGKFVITGMQENALHGWRLQDGSHFRMSGYPAKIRNLSFSFDAKQMATSGAPELVLWPFHTASGPVNQAASVIGEMGAPTCRVVCNPVRPILAAGDAAGEVAVQALSGQGRPILVQAQTGAPITALAWSADGARLAFSDDQGAGGVVDFSSVIAK